MLFYDNILHQVGIAEAERLKRFIILLMISIKPTSANKTKLRIHNRSRRTTVGPNGLSFMIIFSSDCSSIIFSNSRRFSADLDSATDVEGNAIIIKAAKIDPIMSFFLILLFHLPRLFIIGISYYDAFVPGGVPKSNS